MGVRKRNVKRASNELNRGGSSLSEFVHCHNNYAVALKP